MSAETWRVACEGGAVREVTVRHTPGSYGGEWRADSDGEAAGGSSARQAALTLAAGDGWPVVELVAPGAQPSEERLAQVTADRDYWHEQAIGMAPCVDEIRRLTLRVVRGGTGCALDPVRAVDAAIAQADALADADLIMEQRERQITAALTAAAEERAERDAARAEADALRAIVDGRAEAPTDAERAVHAGEWLVRYRDSRACRWWPLDSTGRPCAWPTGGAL